VILQKLNDASTQTIGVRNLEEEISSLESTVKKLEKELQDEKNKKERTKNTLESKLEQRDKRVKVIFIFCLCNFVGYGFLCIFCCQCLMLVRNWNVKSAHFEKLFLKPLDGVR
jgi:hypothetical protein